MTNENNQQSADKAIGSINKDFKIVGSHRVHSWYAWAIVGIVFGMALGIVYIANRSGQATSIEAAQKKSNLAVIGTVEKYLPIVSNRTNPNIWIGALPISYTTNTYLQAPTETAIGVKISKFFKPGKSALGAIGIVGTKIYHASLASNGDYVIDATKAPAADMSKEVTYNFNGIYQQDDGNSKTKLKNIPVTVNVDFRCSAIVPGTKCSDPQTIFSNYRGKDAASVSQNPLAAPAGIAFYATKVNFMMPNDKTRVVNKTLILPAGGGTHTLVFRKNPKTGKFFIYKFIVGPSDTGQEIELPENPDDGEDSNPNTPPVVEATLGGNVYLRASIQAPSNKSVIMGTSNNELARFRISSDSNKPAGIASIVIVDNMKNNSIGYGSLATLYLYDGQTKIAGPVALAQVKESLAVALFTFDRVLGIGSFGFKELIVKGEFNTFDSGGWVSGSEHVFCIQNNGDVKGPDAVLGAPTCGNTVTTYASGLSVTASTFGASTNRAPVSNDKIGELSLIAGDGASVKIKSIKISMSGGALKGAGSFSARLVDADTGVNIGSSSVQTCTPNANNTCSITFNPDYDLSANTTKRALLMIDSTMLTNSPNAYDSLTATISGPGDLIWSDGMADDIQLESSNLPIVVSTVLYQ